MPHGSKTLFDKVLTDDESGAPRTLTFGVKPLVLYDINDFQKITLARWSRSRYRLSASARNGSVFAIGHP